MKATGSLPAVTALLLLCIAAIPVAALAAPDLGISSFSPPTGAVERTFTIPNAVRNAGTTGSGSGFTVGFVLSSDTTLDLDDTLIGTRVLPSLAAGATSARESTSVSVPDSVPAGTYYLAMLVDINREVAESDETNNYRIDPDPVVVPARPRPDLAPWYLTPSVYRNAEYYLLDAAVENIGTAPSGRFTVGFYLSDDAAITTADTLLQTATCDGIAADGWADVGVVVKIPASIPPGPYHAGMIIDTANAVVESSEANNVYGADLWISDLPDLAPAALAVPSLELGRAFAINSTVTNHGRTPTGPFRIDFALSNHTTLDAGYPVIGSESVAGLAAGASANRTTTATVPAGVPAGSYYLFMLVDNGGAVEEVLEENNLAVLGSLVSTPIRVVDPAPDIASSNFRAIPGRNAREIAISSSAKNDGAAPTGNFTAAFYLSDDTAITTADHLIGTRAYASIGAGAGTFSQWDELAVPLSVPAGHYFAGVILDPAGEVAESDETNNVAVDLEGLAVSDLPDLAPFTFGPPSGPVARTFSLNSGAINDGATATGPFTVGFYLSTDMTITTGDVLIGTRAYEGLAPFSSAPGQWTTVTVPPSVPAGSYYVGEILDPENAVAEAVETNNVIWDLDPVTIPAAAPDLGIASFSVAGTGAFKQYDFRGKARNYGSAPTGPFSVAYYLSDDTTFTLSDTLLGVAAVDDLAAGASVDLHRFCTVPASVPAGGPYYLGAILDPTNAVAESNEANNTAYDPDPVVISGLPDLTISMLRLPDGVAARTFVIESAFWNAGMTPAGPFEVEFYLSTDQTITRGDALIGTRSHGGLAAGTAGPLENTTATVPPSVPAGTYYLGVIIDPANAVAEAIESNNVLHMLDPIAVPPAVVPVPPSTLVPTDTDGDGIYDDVNGNGRRDFNDVVLYFNAMTWIAANEPVSAFDCNKNGRIDFADVVWLFNHL